MGKIKKQFNYFLFLILGIILGGLVGILSMSFMVSYRIEQYYKEIQSLQYIIEDKNTRLEKLEETIHNKKLVVKNTIIEFQFEESDQRDEIVVLTLEKHIKSKLKDIIGKEVEKVDVDMLWLIVDNRIMRVEGKEYKLLLDKLLVAQDTKLWIKVKLMEKQ